MPDVKPGEWYLGFYCRKCQKPIVLLHDPSKGKVKMAGPGRHQAQCPSCGHQSEYGTEEFESFEAHKKD